MNDQTELHDTLFAEAKRQFLELGPTAVTVESVIGAVGCTQSDFSQHWESIVELRHEILRTYTAGEFAIIDQLTTAARAQNTEPVEQSLAFFELFYEDFLRDWYEVFQVPPTGDVFSAFIYAREGVDPGSYDQAVDGLNTWVGRFTDIISPVVDASTTATEETAAELARMMISINLGAIILGRATNDPFLLTRQQKLFGDYLRRIADRSP